MNNKTLLEQFYQYLLIEKNYSKHTIEAYFRDIEQFNDMIKPTPLLEIDLSMVKNYMTWLRDSFANNTVLRKLSSLKTLYNYCLANNLISKNYFNEISVSKKKVILPKYLTEEQINLFLNSLTLDTPLDVRNKAMFELIYATGMRISELINLEIKDLNFNEQFVRVTGKGRVERIIPINDIALKYVKLYINEYRLGFNPSCDNVFLNNHGKPLSRQGFYKILKQLALNVGITDISPHQFRHSIATHMLGNGANLKVVQEMLGHKNIATTEIYTHVSNQQIINDYNKYHMFGDDHQPQD